MFPRSSNPTLSRAEWLLTLGFSGLGKRRLEDFACRNDDTTAYRSLELRLMTAGGLWVQGFDCAKHVTKQDPVSLRKAAGRFLVGYALEKAAQDHGTEAAKLIANAQSLWPEGKVDALALGIDICPIPAGRIHSAPATRCRTRGWQSHREVVVGRTLLPWRSRARARYRSVRRGEFKRQLVSKWQARLASVNPLAQTAGSYLQSIKATAMLKIRAFTSAAAKSGVRRMNVPSPPAIQNLRPFSLEFAPKFLESERSGAK